MDTTEVTPLSADELAQLQALQQRQAAAEAAVRDAATAAVRAVVTMPEWQAVKAALTVALSAHPTFDADLGYVPMCMARLEGRYGA